jgi:hypothetical protein
MPIKHVVLVGPSPKLGPGVVGDGAKANWWASPRDAKTDLHFASFQLLGEELSRQGSLKTQLLAHNAELILQENPLANQSIPWRIVGKSGTHKSPALALATAALQQKQTEATEHYQEALQTYERDKALYERDLTQWRRDKKTNSTVS